MLNLHPDSQARTSHCYKVAGQFLGSTLEFSRLKYFEVQDAQESKIDPSDFHRLATTHPSLLRYAGEAPFAGRTRRLELYVDGVHARIVIDGANAYRVDTAKRLAVCCLPDPASDLALELLLGPVAVLFFEALERYFLHAACVATSDGLLAFIAESGVGKSTLSASAGDDWQQVADDVIAIDAQAKFIVADYPQLKLPNAISPAAQKMADQELPLAGIVRLSPIEAEQISINRMAPAHALLQVIRHTVGAKLFDAEQLKRHMQFAQRVAHQYPMWECSYPRDMNNLAEVRQQICKAVAT